MEVLIDSLIGNQGLDSDIAKVISQMFRGLYRYVGNSKWEYKNEHQQWEIDHRTERLWRDIMAFSNNALIHRAIYWENQNEPLKAKMMKDNDNSIQNQMYENSNKSIILLKISHKFKKASYKKQLLEELKSYFVE